MPEENKKDEVHKDEGKNQSTSEAKDNVKDNAKSTEKEKEANPHNKTATESKQSSQYDDVDIKETVKKTLALSDDSKLMALLSYLWAISIIIYIVKKDDAYVTFHARQGTALFLVSVAAWLLGFIIMFIPVLNVLYSTIWILGYLGLMILGAVKASQGEEYKMPVIYDLSKKINF